MPLDYSNPRILKFFTENYEREKNQRVRWFLANKEQLVQQATFTEKHKGYRVEDIHRAPLDISMSILSKQNEVSRINRRKKVPRDGPVLGLAWIKQKDINAETNINTDGLTPLPVMKPVETVEASILCEEFPEGGLRQYLQVRKRRIPEEKYYFCETSSHVIGWQWKESAFPVRPPKYGRYETLLREASRSGPQPDPLHYILQPQRSA